MIKRLHITLPSYKSSRNSFCECKWQLSAQRPARAEAWALLGMGRSNGPGLWLSARAMATILVLGGPTVLFLGSLKLCMGHKMVNVGWINSLPRGFTYATTCVRLQPLILPAMVFRGSGFGPYFFSTTASFRDILALAKAL